MKKKKKSKQQGDKVLFDKNGYYKAKKDLEITDLKAKHGSNAIISEYILNPKTIEGKKFNIRLFVNKVPYLKISEPLFHYNINQSGMFIKDTLMLYSQIIKIIRMKYTEIYKLRSLIRIWESCKHQSSNRYLLKYFIVNLLIIILPAKTYNIFFKTLLLIVRKTKK